MSTLAIQLLIPTLVALSVRVFPTRTVLQWVWVGVVMDIDYLGWILHVNDPSVPNYHRAALHNIWILVLLLACAVLAYRNFAHNFAGQSAQTLTAFLGARRGAGWVLSSYFYFSHILLDFYQGGVAFLWPLSRRTFYHDFAILINTQTQAPEVYNDANTLTDVVDVSPVYLWLSSEEFAFILLTAAAYLCGYLYRRYTRSRGGLPVPKQPKDAVGDE